MLLRWPPGGLKNLIHREVILGVATVAAWFILWALAFRLRPKLFSVVGIWWPTLVGTILVLNLGLGLFLFKKHYLKAYGLAEIGFALAVAWSSIRRILSTNDAASWMATLAAAYFVVRGLSNYDEGRKRGPR